MKRKTKEKAATITQAMLEILMIAGVITLASILSNGRASSKLFPKLGKYSVYRIRQALDRLKFQDMIEFDNDDEDAPIILTTKGLRRAMKYEFLRIFSRPIKWDHFWRLIMFDIPERTGKRRAFQHALVSSGFYRIQNSVYVSPIDLKNQITEYAKLHCVSSRVIITTTSSLGASESSARNHFFRIT